MGAGSMGGQAIGMGGRQHGQHRTWVSFLHGGRVHGLID